MVRVMPKQTNHAEVEYISPGAASKIAFLSIKTLSRLADKGEIGSIRPSSHRRYLRADVEALVKVPA